MPSPHPCWDLYQWSWIDHTTYSSMASGRMPPGATVPLVTRPLASPAGSKGVSAGPSSSVSAVSSQIPRRDGGGRNQSVREVRLWWHPLDSLAEGSASALHRAYMRDVLDCACILRRGDPSEAVVDKLGRTPSDLQPKGLAWVLTAKPRLAQKCTH